MAGMIYEWIQGHQNFLGCMGLVSLVTFLVTPLVVSVIIVRIPEDYFLVDRDHFGEMGRGYNPAVRVLFHVLKNAAGIVFLLAGLAMLVLPGQGVITILMGLAFMDFPGKRALELRIIRRRRVLSAVNWIRARAGKPPLKIRDGNRRQACPENEVK